MSPPVALIVKYENQNSVHLTIRAVPAEDIRHQDSKVCDTICPHKRTEDSPT